MDDSASLIGALPELIRWAIIFPPERAGTDMREDGVGLWLSAGHHDRTVGADVVRIFCAGCGEGHGIPLGYDLLIRITV